MVAINHADEEIFCFEFATKSREITQQTKDKIFFVQRLWPPNLAG